MKQGKKKTGFTLIELLVVIVILGVLSTISVGTFSSYFSQARDTERVSAVQNIAMMIKVDSGGNGDCGTYNYIDGGDTTKTSGEECTTEGNLEILLTDNDYAMPGIKNGLEYFYGFILGDKEGDNEFFVATGAEEEASKNGQVVVGAESIFVDGTGTGIDEGLGCIWVSGEVTCANEDISLFQLDSKGAPSTSVPYIENSCSTYVTDATCTAATCGWSGGCLNGTHIYLTENSCTGAWNFGQWNGVCS